MEKIALDFEKGNGLIPTVIQDYESNEVFRCSLPDVVCSM